MKKRKIQEEKRLLGAWVCDLANRLVNECEVPLTRRAAFATYNLLRVNHQLGRRVGAFDKDVFTKIVGILSKLLVENGTR